MITCVSCDPLVFPSASSSSSSSSPHLLILLLPPPPSLFSPFFYTCKSIYRHFVGDVWRAFCKNLIFDATLSRFVSTLRATLLSELEEILDCSAKCEYRNTWYTWNWSTELCLSLARAIDIRCWELRDGWKGWTFDLCSRMNWLGCCLLEFFRVGVRRKKDFSQRKKIEWKNETK